MQNLNDTVIVKAVRTPVGKAKRGMFKNTHTETLLSHVLKHIIKETKIDPALIGDIVVGSVLGSSLKKTNECRIAALLAGIPESVPIQVVNRQCASGLQSIVHVISNINAGYYDIGIAAGVESMTMNDFVWESSSNPDISTNLHAKNCSIPMGITSDNVAKKFNISRTEQDNYSLLSHTRTANAHASGKLKNEIVPISSNNQTFDIDECFRPNTTIEKLAKLNPIFTENGSTTAGNSSQLSDGAAAVLIMKRKIANKLKLPILGTLKSFAVSGVPPDIMGIGPSIAIPLALQKINLTQDDIDLYEINEAFASQTVYCINKLNLPINKVNVNGGSIAIGHPLGMTGTRMTVTLLHELIKRKQKRGVVSMCIGSGMGAAAIFETE